MLEMNLEERQNMLFDILQKINHVCNIHNITYYVAYGTLLGVVRHQGFIPWDDDVDLWVPIKDYAKLLEKMESCTEYKVINNLCDLNWMNCFAKISDKRTFITDNEAYLWKNTHVTTRGVGIDIFPLFPMNKNSYFYLQFLSKWHMRLFINKRRGYGKVKHLICKFVEAIGFDEVYLHKKILAYEYKERNTQHVGNPIAPYGKKNIYHKEWFQATKYLRFAVGERELQVPAPIGYDKILTKLYGDYMTIPREGSAERHAHDTIKAFWLE